MRLLLSLLVVAVPIVAIAQEASEPDPLGPVRCYEIADDEGLEHTKAVDLCIGAVGDAPGRCYAEADDQTDLADLQIVQLCRLATSSDPVRCVLELDDEEELTNDAIANYCAANTWATTAPPNAGSPVCVRAGLADTRLADREVLNLCRGSQTDAPVRCFQIADDELAISDLDIVRLCTQVVPYPVLTPY